ncbi:DUF397 domain-containing protein [Kitasatospora sp. YST-16]|uniref:DUF397 domain-containing protein n=1 Tax=Kitasatospora sp. YST-16 TaxID=2998080 RepID=UPI002283E4D6|nr:DUF397 domain-containing protein [Kitasatospora sp. YST-16]WAL73133.1 DUF397 domain-containing protein [Kitasatospora sp. YST-16]WNW39187.1 DUF397 domain-containing protein [Streptomyces sp. Li-HN-5-13]
MTTAHPPSITDVDAQRAEWFKSSYSTNNGEGDCVEISGTFTASHGVILVRDSKDPNGPFLRIPATGWAAFAEAAAQGDFGEL